MDIQVKTLPTHRIVCPSGPRLDAIQALNFKKSFRKAIIETDRSVVVDMGRIDFLDSSGLGALIMTSKQVQPPHEIKFANLQPLVERVFRLTQIDRTFEVLKDITLPEGGTL